MGAVLEESARKLRRRLSSGGIAIPRQLHKLFSILPTERGGTASMRRPNQPIELTAGMFCEIAGTTGAGKTTVAMQLAASALVSAMLDLDRVPEVNLTTTTAAAAVAGGTARGERVRCASVGDGNSKATPEPLAVIWFANDRSFQEDVLLELLALRFEEVLRAQTVGQELDAGARLPDATVDVRGVAERSAFAALRLMLVMTVESTNEWCDSLMYVVEDELRKLADGPLGRPCLLVFDSVTAFYFFDSDVDVFPQGPPLLYPQGVSSAPTTPQPTRSMTKSRAAGRRDSVFNQLRRIRLVYNVCAIATRQPLYSDHPVPHIARPTGGISAMDLPNYDFMPASYLELVDYAVFLTVQENANASLASHSSGDTSVVAYEGLAVSIPNPRTALPPLFAAIVTYPIQSLMPLSFSIGKAGVTFS